MSATQFCSPAEFAGTTVTAPVLASDLTISVASVAALKGNSSYPFYATFKNLELVKVTGDTAGASPVTVVRGVDGTTAVAGVAGDSLEQNANAQNVKDLNVAVNALESTIGTFHFAQPSASVQWVIAHNLGRMPSVTVIDSANEVVDADVQYTSSNVVTVNFSAAMAGDAYLN